ncbi:MAG: hypothetical protein D8M57_01045 [Candidatus Scalindua sp. AMX11]|nr:MAG: hypothetical protein DWQ00_15025 [Candidatus Scalindua sp.]NOG84979.1 hypothetical protein [Planctomycetota bacterium]RZV93034.1 MAG: hypothetical protein EX341_03980 [Candidatus Scalindua sp. SCAELEC01]TDE66655.1 MAG: hypothetical protein D8M57_01045 [Candidatus Scalindua sp. AMX11]
MKTIAEFHSRIHDLFPAISAWLRPLFSASKKLTKIRYHTSPFCNTPTKSVKTFFPEAMSIRHQRHIVFNKYTSLPIIDNLSITMNFWSLVVIAKILASYCISDG